MRPRHRLLNEYRVQPTGQLWYMEGDGCARIQAAARHGWQPIAVWGGDGFALGSWPEVVVFERVTPGGFEVVENVKGDCAMWSFPTREIAERGIDQLALELWRRARLEVVANVRDGQVPARLRGPYVWRP